MYDFVQKFLKKEKKKHLSPPKSDMMDFLGNLYNVKTVK